VVRALVALTKPRIIELLLVTTVPTMLLAQRGVPPSGSILVTLVGGTLAAGSANTINCYIDRDIDAIMKRTSRRPLVVNGHGTIKPWEALVWGDRARRRRHAAARPDGQLAVGGAGRRGHLVLHLRVHAAAQAAQPGQHRDRRRRGLLPRAGRLGRGDRHGEPARRRDSSRSSSCGRRRTSGRWR
jgi:Polyprenyltransferase (cytochrome oxidase assembly factor)